MTTEEKSKVYDLMSKAEQLLEDNGAIVDSLSCYVIEKNGNKVEFLSLQQKESKELIESVS